MRRPRLARCAHGTASIESILSGRQAGSSILLFFLVKFQFALPVLSSKWLGLGEAKAWVEEHGDNKTHILSALFEARTNVKLVCWPKALWECCCHKAFRKSQIYQYFLQAWPWAFSDKKKNHSAEVLVSQGTERMRLVWFSSWAFRISMVWLVHKDPPHTPYTLYSLLQWNWFSDVTGCMLLRCIQWPQRTNFTAPGCTHACT